MSRRILVEFVDVYKEYELYHKISYKEMLFNIFRDSRAKKSSKFRALEGISFTIHEGESVGVIGRNGSGKSTTLGLIAGVLVPDRGQVYVGVRPSPLLELGGGFHPDLNAYENIRLNGVILGIDLNIINKNLDNIIYFAGLEEFAEQPVRTYSSGMLARLGFSIVTQLDPKLLLLDEVLAVGDEAFRQKCLDLMLGFKQRGTTIIFVSHNADEIEKICDRVIWIDEHRIRMDGAAHEVLRSYHEYMQQINEAKERDERV